MADNRESLRATLRAEQAHSAPLGSLQAVADAAVAVCDKLRAWGGVVRLPPEVQRIWQMAENREFAPLGNGPMARAARAHLVCNELHDSHRSLQQLPPDVCAAFNCWQDAARAREHWKNAEASVGTPSAPRM